MSFEGFPPATSVFLAGLTENNSKAWFDAHRPEYEQHYLEPAKAFATSMQGQFAKFAPGITAEPRVNGSIFRINRDVRFSKDKTPYKNHLDIWIYEGGDRKSGFSGFFFRMYADSVILGSGIHGFEKEELGKFRQAVDGETSGKALAAVLNKLAGGGYETGGGHYKKMPRGFAADHPCGDLLRHNALYAHTEVALPSEARAKAFSTWCGGHFKKLLLLHEWLLGNVR